MTHPSVLTLTRKDTGETVSLSGQFSDEDWQCLENFVEYTTDLLTTKFVKDGMPSSLNMHWDEKSGMVVATQLPLWDDVIVFLHRFRPLGLASENTYFYKICNILTRQLVHPYFRSMIEEQREIFSGKRFQAQIRISSDDIILNSEKVLYDWLNSYEYHRDKEKRAIVESLLGLLPLDAMKVFFLTLLCDKTQAIHNVAALARVVLGKQKSVDWNPTPANREDEI